MSLTPRPPSASSVVSADSPGRSASSVVSADSAGRSASSVTGIPRQLSSSVRALAAAMEPADPRSVFAVLEPLRLAFADHRAATEGAAGLYAGVVQDAPRLAHAVDGLVAEHHCIDAAMTRLAAIVATGEPPVQAVRDGAREVLDELVRHGQRDADLVYDAYTTDIGGE